MPQMLSNHYLPNESPAAKSMREQHFPMSLLVHGCRTCLEKGEATMKDDKTKILAAMAGAPLNTSEGGASLAKNLKFANHTLQGTIALLAWPQAMKRGMLKDLGRGISSETVSLPEILSQNTSLESLHLSLAHFKRFVRDAEVGLLSQSLPPRLKSLTLFFEDCEQITDAGLKALSGKLQTYESLRCLYLDFIGCILISDNGLRSLLASLPSGLEELELHFAGCLGITAFSRDELKTSLPKGLKMFTASFRGTALNQNFRNIAEL